MEIIRPTESTDYSAEDSPEAIEVQEVAASEFKRLVERLKEESKKKAVNESSDNP